MGEGRSRQTSRREKLGYWPLVLLSLVIVAVAVLSVGFKLGS